MRTTTQDVQEGVSAARGRVEALTTHLDSLSEERASTAFDAFSGDADAARRLQEIEGEIASAEGERALARLAVEAGQKRLAGLRAEEAAAQRAQDLVLLAQFDGERDATMVKVEDAVQALVAAAREARQREVAWLVMAVRCEVSVGLPPSERLAGYVGYWLSMAGVNTGPQGSHPGLAAPLSKERLARWEQEQAARRG